MLQRIPRKLEEKLGQEASDEFVSFLNDYHNEQRGIIVQLVEDKFERKLGEVRSEINKLRSDFEVANSELRADMKTELTGIKTDIAELESGIKIEIADLRTDMKTELVNIYKEIAKQTKWILGSFLGTASFIVILFKILDKFFP